MTAINSQPKIIAFTDVRMDLWEIAEYAGETLVFIGVVIEVIAEWKEPEKKRLAKIGSIVLVIGLAMSLAALIGTNEHFSGTIADLNNQAAQANLARSQLEKSMEWRHLSAGAKESICKLLPPQTPESETVVVTVWTDPEPAQYAQEFAEGIGSCRPLPVPIGTDAHQGPKLALSSWSFPVLTGVNIEFPEKDEAVANTLLSELKAAGVDARIPPIDEWLAPKSNNRFIVIGIRAIPKTPPQ